MKLDVGDLKPCPFCGSRADVITDVYGTNVWGLVSHRDGCFFLADGLPIKQQHIPRHEFAAWNRRAS